jgi:hypothetical protein
VYSCRQTHVWISKIKDIRQAHVKAEEKKKRSVCNTGLVWWKELSQSIKVLGFKRLNSDARISVCREGTKLIMAVVYVDDAMFFGKNKKLVNKRKLSS